MGILKKILSKVFRYYDERCVINIKNRDAISDKATLKGTSIFGNVEISEGAKIIKGVRIQGDVKIGRYTTINGPNTDIISLIHPVIIGNFTSIARNVSIQEYNHDFGRLSSYFFSLNILKEDITNDVVSKGSVEIGHDVWIGTQCVILSGTKIGNGAVVAANSVVTGDVPPYAIVAGSPAKVLKYRFEQPLIFRLQELEWWNWPIDKLIRNKDLFLTSLSEEKLKNINE